MNTTFSKFQTFKQFDTENFNFLCMFLPKGWMKKAKELGAFSRAREFSSPKVLLRTLLIHLITGKSLKETVLEAKLGKLCSISHVALSLRLQKCREWFHWMNETILKEQGVIVQTPGYLKDYIPKAVDASVVSEHGSTGTDWRLHYSMNLFELKTDQYKLTDPEQGESLSNFEIKEREIWIGDRAYCSYIGIKHVHDNGGEFVLRYRSNGIKLLQNGKEFNLQKQLSSLKLKDIGEWQLEGTRKDTKQTIPLRLIAIKKSKVKQEESVKKYVAQLKKRGKPIYEDTLELQKYIIVVSSLPNTITAEQILDLYRKRWQIEIKFKRMKSILGFGQLPKKDKQSCLSWLEGKFLVVNLIDSIIQEGNFFSPWGYRI